MLVFALIVLVNGEIDNNATSHWYDLNRCRYFAEELTIQGTRRRYQSPVLAYCVPRFVDVKKVEVYR
tara:strand:+ start:6950 stop:7150 length:201 start_codon:yes stop_codon:yes gene_type:complete